MKIEKVKNVFFSATKSTEKILSIITENIDKPMENIDITNYSAKDKVYEFAFNELAIFGVPVYGGRVPTPAVERLKKFHGEKTPAIIVVTYGNREYDDALLELKTIVEENNFVVVGAAAFITEHSIMHSVAKGRPDKNDEMHIRDFSNKVLDKVKKSVSIEDILEVKVRGNEKYKEYNGIPLKPKVTKACIKCKVCAESCPVGAISRQAPEKTNKDKCISCMRCIKVCPRNARKLNKIMLAVAEKSFSKKYSLYRENEIFL